MDSSAAGRHEAALAAQAHGDVLTRTRPPTPAQVENFGALRHEKTRASAATGKILTQMHEATDAEQAVLEGIRPLVQRSAVGGGFSMAEPVGTAYL